MRKLWLDCHWYIFSSTRNQVSMSATNASIKDSMPRYRSIFCGLGKSPSGGNQSLMEAFRRLITGNESADGIIRLGDVKVSSRMTVNNTPRTLAFVTWQEQDRIFGASFTLEDSQPCPGSIIDLSDSVRFA
jgi:hypothetical protein